MHQCFNRMLVLEAMKFFSFDIRAAIEEAASLSQSYSESPAHSSLKGFPKLDECAEIAFLWRARVFPLGAEMPFDQEKEMAAQAGCGQSALIPYLEDPLLQGFREEKHFTGCSMQL